MIRRRGLYNNGNTDPYVKEGWTLFADWEGADAPNDGKWVDRISSLEITLTNVTHANNQYTIDNTQTSTVAATSKGNFDKTKLLAKVEYEICIVVDAEVQIDIGKTAAFIDFGSIGSGGGKVAFCLGVKRNSSNISECMINPKLNGTNATTSTNVPAGTLSSVLTHITGDVKITLDDILEMQAFGKLSTGAIRYTTAAITANKISPNGLLTLGIPYNADSNVISDTYKSIIKYNSIKMYSRN